MWDKLTTLLADRSRWIAVVCLCSAAIPAYWLRNARVDNSIEVWTGTRSEAHRTYQRFLEKYGNEEFVVIAGEAQDPLSEDALAFQSDLASRLRQIDQVEGVLDITQVAAAFRKFRPDDWKESLRGNDFFQNLLLGADGHTYGVIAVMGAVGVTTLWTVGLMVLAGRTFNMVTVTLPSLLMVLSLSAGIHIVLRIQSLLADAGDRRAAVRKTIRKVLPAILLSNITTAIGFGSLMMSDMRPVLDFGLFASLGMMLSFFFNATIVPGILSWLRPGAITVSARPTYWTARAGRAVASRRLWFLASSLVVLGVSLLLMTGLRVESNVLKFFPADSKVRRDYQFIAERLTGLYTIELDAVTDSQGGGALLKQIEQLGTDLAGVTMLTASAADFLVLPACVASVNLWNGRGHKP